MTNDKDLPPLPEPKFEETSLLDARYDTHHYDATQMQAYARQAVAEALAGNEEANKKQAAAIELFKRSVTENAIPRANAELRERAKRAEAEVDSVRQKGGAR